MTSPNVQLSLDTLLRYMSGGPTQRTLAGASGLGVTQQSRRHIWLISSQPHNYVALRVCRHHPLWLRPLPDQAGHLYASGTPLDLRLAALAHPARQTNVPATSGEILASCPPAVLRGQWSRMF